MQTLVYTGEHTLRLAERTPEYVEIHVFNQQGQCIGCILANYATMLPDEKAHVNNLPKLMLTLYEQRPWLVPQSYIPDLENGV